MGATKSEMAILKAMSQVGVTAQQAAENIPKGWERFMDHLDQVPKIEREEDWHSGCDRPYPMTDCTGTDGRGAGIMIDASVDVSEMTEAEALEVVREDRKQARYRHIEELKQDASRGLFSGFRKVFIWGLVFAVLLGLIALLVMFGEGDVDLPLWMYLPTS